MILGTWHSWTIYEYVWQCDQGLTCHCYYFANFPTGHSIISEHNSNTHTDNYTIGGITWCGRREQSWDVSSVWQPTQHQDVQTPTPLHSGSLVGSVDRLNGGMEVHSPATLSFSDISPISPLSTPSTPDHHTQHDPEGDSWFEDDSAADQGNQSQFFFELVGDNLNKNIKPRDMQSDHQTESLHFFNTLAVRDRVNLAQLWEIELI